MSVPEGWAWSLPDWRVLVRPEYDRTLDASAMAYDDSGWTLAPAAFCAPGLTHPVFPTGQTVVPKDSTVWVRRQVAGAGTTEVRIDGFVDVWLDGALILSDRTDGAKTLGLTIPYAGTLAVRFEDDTSDPSGDWTYCDVALPVALPVVRQYPRDDGRGLSAAPRLHPTPRAPDLRVVGGLQ